MMKIDLDNLVGHVIVTSRKIFRRFLHVLLFANLNHQGHSYSSIKHIIRKSQ
jgi:hypothetical protein